MIENAEEMTPDLRFPPNAGSMLAAILSVVKPTGGWFQPVEDDPDDVPEGDEK